MTPLRPGKESSRKQRLLEKSRKLGASSSAPPSAGWFGVGAVAGGVLLGPLGLIPGAGVGSAVGRTVGSQLGGETMRYLSGTGAAAQRWPVPAKNPAESGASHSRAGCH